MKLSRREMISFGVPALAGAILAPGESQAAPVNPPSAEVPTGAAWPEHRKKIERSWLNLLGEFPTEIPPLNPVIKEVARENGVTRYHVSFQAEADDRITAWLLVPDSARRQPTPAIICLHSTTWGTAKDSTIGLAGIIPGAIKGSMLALTVLVFVAIWPIMPASPAVVRESNVGRVLLPFSGQMVPFANDRVNRLGLPVTAGVTSAENLRLLNDERVKNGLRPLTVDPAIREVARGYSEELFRSGRFDHQSPVSGTPADRLTRGKVTFEVAGENLAYAPTALIAHNGLMASPGHRANILSPRFSRVGIGAVQSPGRGLVITQNFAD